MINLGEMMKGMMGKQPQQNAHDGCGRPHALSARKLTGCSTTTA